MSIAYVDTSCLVAIAFGERGATALARQLAAFDELVTSDLLEAELRSAFVRERIAEVPDALSSLTWVLPDRPLGAEIGRVLDAGYVRGAVCWHLATALYLAPDSAELVFLTLDKRQRDVAHRLGFSIR
ncbi:MAG TPA: PIN domain-containing protein [Gemmatimonadaceae bacterium]|nr:PIN domain-containing protein [Gemmatimonadaceae bacterium]